MIFIFLSIVTDIDFSHLLNYKIYFIVTEIIWLLKSGVWTVQNMRLKKIPNEIFEQLFITSSNTIRCIVNSNTIQWMAFQNEKEKLQQNVQNQICSLSINNAIATHSHEHSIPFHLILNDLPFSDLEIFFFFSFLSSFSTLITWLLFQPRIDLSPLSTYLTYTYLLCSVYVNSVFFYSILYQICALDGYMVYVCVSGAFILIAWQSVHSFLLGLFIHFSTPFKKKT